MGPANESEAFLETFDRQNASKGPGSMGYQPSSLPNREAQEAYQAMGDEAACDYDSLKLAFLDCIGHTGKAYKCHSQMEKFHRLSEQCFKGLCNQ